MKFNLVKAKKEIAEVKAENARLKQAINLNIYSYDDLKQYNRRENIRIYGVSESSGKKDDGEHILFEIVDELGIEPDNWYIQRCHRQDKKPKNGKNAKSNNGKTKSRSIIVRFVSYKKRTEFLKSKKDLKKSKKFPNTYFTKDLKISYSSDTNSWIMLKLKAMIDLWCAIFTMAKSEWKKQAKRNLMDYSNLTRWSI